MAETTEKYGLRTPSQNNFFDVKDVSENMEKLENALTEFDDSGTVEDITSFPDFLTKFVTGNKLAVTIRNLKAGLQFVLHAGQIVNNCVTDNAGLPLSAAQGKVLMDMVNQLNSSLTPKAISLSGTYANNIYADRMGCIVVVNININVSATDTPKDTVLTTGLPKSNRGTYTKDIYGTTMALSPSGELTIGTRADSNYITTSFAYIAND